MRHRQLVAMILLFMIVPAIAAFGLAERARDDREVIASASSPAVLMSQPTDSLYSLPQPTPTPPPPTTTTTHYHPPTTQPPVVRAAAPAPSGNCGGWEGAITAHFPGEQVAKACRVMMCESGGNPRAQNSRSSASGLFQFLNSTWESATGTPAPASAYSPDVQVAAAAKLWRSSGWRPWVCR